MRRMAVLAFCAWIGLLGCRAERVGPAPEKVDAPSAPSTPNAPAESAAKKTHMAWGDKIAWRSWDSAQTLARTEGKSICVVVYAEWCSRCKELAPIFAKPEVASAAAKLVMVHQDQDEPAAWLREKLGAYGSYVPRVFFLSSQGDVRADLTSGHPRYPHFYAPMIADQLVANMRAASAL